jgi:hypothetical protein
VAASVRPKSAGGEDNVCYGARVEGEAGVPVPRVRDSSEAVTQRARDWRYDKVGPRRQRRPCNWAARLREETRKWAENTGFGPSRAQLHFPFIFSFPFLFSPIFESKFKFQICDELVLKFSEYMIWINHCGINFIYL